MRLTIDYDSKSSLQLSLILFKGLLLLRKLPKKVRMTSKGFHIIFSGLNINEETSYKYRRRLHDDINRIRIDLSSNKRVKQILFSEKITTYYGSVMGELFWRMGINPPVNFKKCPICNKKALKSVKTWEKENRVIEVYHKNSVCRFPIKNRVPAIFKMLKRMGIETET